MGVAIYPVLEDGSAGWTNRIEGKSLARAVEVLDRRAKKCKARTLFFFYSWSREEAIIEQLGGDPDDPSTFDESQILLGKWYDPTEGLVTVRVLLEYVRSCGDKIDHVRHVIEDLEEFERVLSRAAAGGVRWYLGLSE